MSGNITVQMSKTNYISKLEMLINSYNLLKSILSPNLPENNNSFMSYLIELIISQIKFFVELLDLNEDKKLYELLNFNNQNLSKQIAFLYDISKCPSNTKSSFNTIFDRKNNKNNQTNTKESYYLDEKKESTNRKNSDNFEFNYNNTESKVAENDLLDGKNINNNENRINSYSNTQNFEYKEEKDKLIENNAKGKENEKNEIVRNLNFNNNKEKEKSIQVPTQNKIIKKFNFKPKNKVKEKEKENKFQFKKNILYQTNRTKNYLNTIKSNKYESPTSNAETKIKKSFSKIGFKEFQEKIKEKILNKKTKAKTKEENPELKKIKQINIKNDYIENKNNEENHKIKEDNNEKNYNSENNKGKKFERRNRKSKTVIFKTLQLPYLIDIETSENNLSPEDNYIAITFSNEILEKVRTPGNSSHKAKNMKLNKINEKNESNSEFKKDKKIHVKSKDYFSLDEFLTPDVDKNGENIFLTKKGNVSINKRQKDILEDYINNYLFDEEDDKSCTTEFDKRPKIRKTMNDKKNRKFVIKGTSLYYNLKDVNEVLQILPKSFKVPIDDFYLRKKKASMFDTGIFKICHKVIDNYKILEGKEDIYQFKKSRSKPRFNIHQRKNDSRNKSLNRYQNRKDGFYNKNMYSK